MEQGMCRSLCVTIRNINSIFISDVFYSEYIHNLYYWQDFLPLTSEDTFTMML